MLLALVDLLTSTLREYRVLLIVTGAIVLVLVSVLLASAALDVAPGFILLGLIGLVFVGSIVWITQRRRILDVLFS